MENVTHWTKVFALAVIVFFILDMVWLGVVAKSYYRQQLGDYLLVDFNWGAAIAFYLIFLFGLLFFVVASLPLNASIYQVIIRSILCGVVTYATYDLTNLATIKNWPLMLSLVDMTWGGVLSGIVGSVSFYFHRWLLT